MKYFLHIILVGFLMGSSLFGMHRVCGPKIQRFTVQQFVRTGSSGYQAPKEDIFKNLKEALGVKSDLLFYTYLGTLGYIYYQCIQPKSAYRHERHRRIH